MWQDIPLYCHNGHYYRQIHNLGQFKCTQHAADFNERANQWPCCGKPRYNPGCVPADHNTHTFRYGEKHSVHGMPEALLAMFRNGPGVVGNVIHRFDRDEDERLNPYLSNGYTLKKPRVEKRAAPSSEDAEASSSEDTEASISEDTEASSSEDTEEGARVEKRATPSSEDADPGLSVFENVKNRAKDFLSWVAGLGAQTEDSGELDRKALEKGKQEFEREQFNIQVGLEEIEQETKRLSVLRDELQSEIAEAEKLRKRYEKGLEKLTRDKTDLTSRDAGMTATHKKILAKYGTVESLREDIVQRRKDLDELNTKIGSFELEKLLLKTEKEKLELELKNLRRGIKRARSATKNLQSKNEAKKQRLEEEIKGKKREFDQLQKDLGTIKDQQTRLDGHEAIVKARDGKINSLTQKSLQNTLVWQKAKDGLEEEIKNLKEKLAEKKGRILQLKVINEGLDKHIVLLDSKVSQSEEEFSRWKELLPEMKVKLRKDLDESNEKIRKIKFLLNQSSVIYFLPVLLYVKSLIREPEGLLEDLLWIFYAGTSEVTTNVETVVKRTFDHFDIDDDDISEDNLRRKSVFKTWEKNVEENKNQSPDKKGR